MWDADAQQVQKRIKALQGTLDEEKVMIKALLFENAKLLGISKASLRLDEQSLVSA